MIRMLTFNTALKAIAVWAIAVLACLNGPNANAQSSHPWLQTGHTRTTIASRDSSAMKRLVKPLSDSVDQSVVQVFSGSRLVSLGTVVAEDGYVITKRSELTGDPVSVRLPGGRKVRARVSAVRRSNDLAMLKIEDDEPLTWDISPIQFSNDEPPTGSFVISPGRDGYTIGLGTLGVSARHIGHKGRLGVRFYNASNGPATVQRVAPSSGAEIAGLQGGDRITRINGLEMLGSQAAIRTLGQMYPGDIVQLTVVRDGETMEVNALMSDQAVLMESENDAKVNGPRNVRLSGFDSVIQHDTVLAPNQCGGPVLDTKGKVVGVNIARAGRVVSYALPASLVAAEVISMLDESRR